jgi:hypothetical protein
LDINRGITIGSGLLLRESNVIENNKKQAFGEVKFYKEGFERRIDVCKDKTGNNQ